MHQISLRVIPLYKLNIVDKEHVGRCGFTGLSYVTQFPQHVPVLPHSLLVCHIYIEKTKNLSHELCKKVLSNVLSHETTTKINNHLTEGIDCIPPP